MTKLSKIFEQFDKTHIIAKYNSKFKLFDPKLMYSNNMLHEIFTKHNTYTNNNDYYKLKKREQDLVSRHYHYRTNK